MRITFFPASAIGHVNYPEAILVRGLASGLHARGHDIRIVEERRNPVLTQTLQKEGATISRHVYEAHPELVIHSYTGRTGARLLEWVSRELSLVDVGVAVHGLPDEVARWIANLTHPTLIRTYLTYSPIDLTNDLIQSLEIDRLDNVFAPGQPAAAVDWESVPPSISDADRAAGLLDEIPANLRDALVDPDVAARAFEAALSRTKMNRYSTNGSSSSHSSNAT